MTFDEFISTIPIDIDWKRYGRIHKVIGKYGWAYTVNILVGEKNCYHRCRTPQDAVVFLQQKRMEKLEEWFNEGKFDDLIIRYLQIQKQ